MLQPPQGRHCIEHDGDGIAHLVGQHRRHFAHRSEPLVADQLRPERKQPFGGSELVSEQLNRDEVVLTQIRTGHREHVRHAPFGLDGTPGAARHARCLHARAEGAGIGLGDGAARQVVQKQSVARARDLGHDRRAAHGQHLTHQASPVVPHRVSFLRYHSQGQARVGSHFGEGHGPAQRAKNRLGGRQQCVRAGQGAAIADEHCELGDEALCAGGVGDVARAEQAPAFGGVPDAHVGDDLAAVSAQEAGTTRFR